MKPREKIASAETSDGKILALYSHDGDYSMNLDGQELMHSRANTSERLLGSLGVERLTADSKATILVGGLGLGYTLDSVLKGVGPDVIVEVVELLSAVVAWNREHLTDLNGALLEDARVKVREEDVTRLIRTCDAETYDVIVLDIDNGPMPLVTDRNIALYSATGLRAVYRALAHGGRAVFWSAGPDEAFDFRLKRAGFRRVTAVPAKVHPGAKRAAYLLYVADR